VSVGQLGRRSIALILLLLWFVQPVRAQEVPIPPAPTQYVTDTVGFLPPATVDRLNSRLRDYEQQTQHQIIVWIGSTTGDVPIEDWATRAFEKWGVGRKGLDDGLALFIMAKDRRLRIEVGYGLEGDVGDLRAHRIIDEVIVPRIRAGDNGGAVEAGVEALIERIARPEPAGDAAPAAERGRTTSPMTTGSWILLGILAVIVLAVLATSPGFAVWMLLSILSGGNRRRGRRGGGYWGGGFGGGGWGGGGWGGGGGGWSSGGGGFSGGGGMSGGGGASGSW
jgi:uncharacterized protein